MNWRKTIPCREHRFMLKKEQEAIPLFLFYISRIITVSCTSSTVSSALSRMCVRSLRCTSGLRLVSWRLPDTIRRHLGIFSAKNKTTASTANTPAAVRSRPANAVITMSDQSPFLSLVRRTHHFIRAVHYPLNRLNLMLGSARRLLCHLCLLYTSPSPRD